MDELLERLKLQSEHPKLGVYSHNVCIVRQDDLLKAIEILEKIKDYND